MHSVTCDYCRNPAKLVTGADVYPHRPDLREKFIWSCDPCGAYVGCHPGTTRPLGRLADALLRRAKVTAHAAFDLIWKGGFLRRGAAYGWLAHAMGLPSEECHIGMLTVEQCEKVVTLCSAFVAEQEGR